MITPKQSTLQLIASLDEEVSYENIFTELSHAQMLRDTHTLDNIPEENIWKTRKEHMDEIASHLMFLLEELSRIEPELKYEMDKDAVSAIKKDLSWAVENCSVIANHQIDKSLDDTMGYKK